MYRPSRARRVREEPAAPSACREPGELLGYTVVVRGVVAHLGDRAWAETEAANWLSQLAVVAEVRAVITGEEIRAARLAEQERLYDERRAADELTALTEELGLYDDGRRDS
jgi:hypothetical protein